MRKIKGPCRTIEVSRGYRYSGNVLEIFKLIKVLTEDRQQ